MTDRTRPLVLVLSVALGATLLSGCVVAPAPRPVYQAQPQVVYQQPPPQGGYVQPQPQVIQMAPPQPQVEVYGAAPGPGYFWIGGNWIWDGGRHVWRGGHWEAHRRGQSYVPHAWVRNGRGWESHGGHWRH